MYSIYIYLYLCLCVFVTAQLFRALLSSSLLNTIAAAQAHQKQPWRSHSNATGRHWAAKQHRTTCAAATLSNTGAATPTRFCKEAYKVNVPVLTQCGQCLEISSGEDKPTLLWFQDKHYEWLTGYQRWSWFFSFWRISSAKWKRARRWPMYLKLFHRNPPNLHFRSGPWNRDVKPAWARPKHNWLTWQQWWAQHSSSPSGSGPCSVGRTRKSRCGGPWGGFTPLRVPAKTPQDPGHWLSKSTRA